MKWLLCAVAIVCACGWFFNKLSVKILLCFMQGKGYTPPTKSELKACSRKVVEQLFTFDRRNRS